MKKTVRKLSLSRETVQRLDVRGGVAAPGVGIGNASCVQSCYFVSCGDTTCTQSGCGQETQAQ
jgi:hypothetical protein